MRVHSGVKNASIPTETEASVVLADTLQAFDLLHSATCGKAPPDELVAHYGIKNAHQIMQAREQIARTRRTTTANSVGTERSEVHHETGEKP